MSASPTQEGRFAGQVAVVTGASRGIGLAIAQRIVDEGGRVVITARKQAALDDAVDSLGGREVAVSVAGSSDDAVHQRDTIATAVERFGRLDVLINNTGINPAYGPTVDADPGLAAKIFSVNVLGSLGWVREALAGGFSDGTGTVVNVASAAGLRPADGIGLYGASKAALVHLTQQLAVELAPQIRVNAVAPAVVRTRFAEALFEGREDDVIARYPAKRLGTPEDVAAAVAFLASAESAWITGQVLAVDGGLLLTGGI
jgi:NAD(P)-dependent dehydrogenase (short-subunit alcohol dehydrogenase family)